MAMAWMALTFDLRVPNDSISHPEVQPAKRAKRSEDAPLSDPDVAMGSAHRMAAGESSSSWGSSSSSSDSDVSSEDASSDEPDLDKLEAAYTEFAGLSRGLEHIPTERMAVGVTSEDVPGLPLTGGLRLCRLWRTSPGRGHLHASPSPLSRFSKQLERLLEGYCLELIATNAVPAPHNGAVRQFAKDLVMVLAMHLAQRIASLLRNVIHGPPH